MSFKYFDYAGKDRRASPKEIGAKLGVDERTVRLRLNKMEKEGFIQYYQIIPNLGILGRPLASLCNFQSPNLTCKFQALEILKHTDDVIDIADFLGESFGVTISSATEDEANRIAERLAEKSRLSQF